MSLFAWFLNNQLNSSNFFQLMSPFYHICSLLMKAISLKQIIHRQLVLREQKMFKCPQCGCLCNFLLSRLSCVLRFAWTPEHWSIPPDHPKLAPLVVWVEQNTRALCWWSSPAEHLRPFEVGERLGRLIREERGRHQRSCRPPSPGWRSPSSSLHG